MLVVGWWSRHRRGGCGCRHVNGGGGGCQVVVVVVVVVDGGGMVGRHRLC